MTLTNLGCGIQLTRRATVSIVYFGNYLVEFTEYRCELTVTDFAQNLLYLRQEITTAGLKGSIKNLVIVSVIFLSIFSKI